MDEKTMQQQLDDLKADFDSLLSALNLAAQSGTDENGGGVLEEALNTYNAFHYARIQAEAQMEDQDDNLEELDRAVVPLAKILALLSDDDETFERLERLEKDDRR